MSGTKAVRWKASRSIEKRKARVCNTKWERNKSNAPKRITWDM